MSLATLAPSSPEQIFDGFHSEKPFKNLQNIKKTELFSFNSLQNRAKGVIFYHNKTKTRVKYGS